jgi:hypothetical protein
MSELLFDEDWRVLKSFLPWGWQKQARELGALRRTRSISNAEVLLRVVLMHVGPGLSLRQTVARAAVHKLATLSDVALLKRLRGAEKWLGWISRELAQSHRFDFEGLGKQRRWRAVDATVVSESGAKGQRWRVHYSLRLPEMACDHFELSDAQGGERFSRFAARAGDVLLADRGYCRRGESAAVLDAHADVVMRWHSSSFPLETKSHQVINVLKKVQRLTGYQSAQWTVGFHYQGRYYPLRLCAIRRSQRAAEKARAEVLESARKSNYEASKESLQLADYTIVLTSLPEEEFGRREVLNLYRLRWQIELAFKRLKSLLSLGNLPKYDPASSRSWLQGKLLCALLIERLIGEAETLSPWGFAWPEDQPLEPLS